MLHRLFGLAMVAVTDLLLRGEDWADGLGLLLRGLIAEAVFFPLLGFGFSRLPGHAARAANLA
ncbi:MAG: hypothetical protein KIS80_04690 [Anaerolineales bacterium]|nr:hypothetical protein [Anaerolineales bacterium]